MEATLSPQQQVWELHRQGLGAKNILAQLAGLIREDAVEKDRRAATERVRQALKDLQQMPGLAGDEALAEAVRQAFVKREEEKEKRRQKRERLKRVNIFLKQNP